MRERGPLAVVAAAIALGALASTHDAWASFNSSAAASTSYTADVLVAPNNPAAAAGTCSVGTGDRTVLSWTATSSSWASGYEIARSTTAGGPFTVIATVSGVSTTTYTDGPLASSTTFYYAIRSMKSTWRSANATVSRKTKGTLCV